MLRVQRHTLRASCTVISFFAACTIASVGPLTMKVVVPVRRIVLASIVAPGHLRRTRVSSSLSFVGCSSPSCNSTVAWCVTRWMTGTVLTHVPVEPPAPRRAPPPDGVPSAPSAGNASSDELASAASYHATYTSGRTFCRSLGRGASAAGATRRASPDRLGNGSSIGAVSPAPVGALGLPVTITLNVAPPTHTHTHKCRAKKCCRTDTWPVRPRLYAH